MNQEDVEQPAVDEGVAREAASLPEPVCPSIPGVILPEFPDLQVLTDVIQTGFGAARSVFNQFTKDPTALANEVKDAFANTSKQVSQAGDRIVEELGDAAEFIAAEARQAALDELSKANTVIQAIRQGAIDLQTDVENLDDITINAMSAQFPGFKNALDCLKGAPGSSVASASGDAAKEQAKTPAPENPATTKEETVPERTEDEGEDAGEPREELSKLEASEKELNDLIEQTGLEQGSVTIEVPNE